MDSHGRQAGWAPTSGEERHEFLDVLRGVALFGIIVANMILYSLYAYLPETAKTGMVTASSDRVLDFLELLLIEGKFYTIFSILFGIGFSILIIRTRAKGLVFHRFFLRRVFILYLIGVAHALFFWHDDILQFYAFCGALLLPFVSCRDRTIVICAALALVTPTVLHAVGGIPPGTFLGPGDLLFERFGFTPETRVDVWAGGGLPEIVRLNLGSWFNQLDYVVTSGMIFRIFGCFLLGFLIGRNELFRNLPASRRMIERLVIIGFAVGIPLNLIYAITYGSESWLHAASATLGILPLSAGYACLVALIWIAPGGGTRLRCFAPVGRMALTNYVGQSVVCSLLFYGTGLGLGGRVGPTVYLPIGIAVYAAQVAASRAWLTRFRYGPLEWLWRVLTYGRWFPLRKRVTT